MELKSVSQSVSQSVTVRARESERGAIHTKHAHGLTGIKQIHNVQTKVSLQPLDIAVAAMEHLDDLGVRKGTTSAMVGLVRA